MSEPETVRYVLCLKTEGYVASLEPRKVYRVVPDDTAETRSLLRIVDESGDDYLYPSEYFVPIEIPKSAASAFSVAS